MQTITSYSCLTCAWSSTVDEDGFVECRRFPPEVHIIDNKPIQLRPRMHPSDICGEHTDPDDI